MKDYIVQPPGLLRVLFPRSFWRSADHKTKQVFITFDDGPVPEETPWVLDMLERYGAHGTFFCVGDNVRKYPEIYEDILRRGHSVGNHTYNHLPLFRVGWREFRENIERCDEVEGGIAKVFRAPHGHITPLRAYQLTRERFARVVFWDVMPKDYDQRLTPEQVVENMDRHIRPGSVLLLHDSIKAGPRMRAALEHALETLTAEGYTFAPLPL